MISRLPLFPRASGVNKRGHLVVGGCDIVDMATEYGTPVYVFDEASLREKCREYKDEFGSRYADTNVVYSCKAFINRTMLILVHEEEIGLDVVSGGELGIARSYRFPMEKVYFAGNNKSREELRLALEYRLGRLVVDNFHELRMLGELVQETGLTQDILLRLTPGVNPHTHRHIITGNVDSKFGIPMVQGEEAIVEAMSLPGVNLLGLHFHIGSQIAEVEPYLESLETILGLAAEMRRKHGLELRELDIGGGYAVQYTLDEPAPPVSYYAEAITSGVVAACQKYMLEPPQLVIEPGRSMVARAGIAVYTTGVVKDIPDVRRYISVDGGMADNIRPSMYEARLEAVIANKMNEPEAEKVTIAGKYCESGDILIWDIGLPRVVAGDIIAVPGCGAYCIPESMNYNASLKPPVVFVNDGKSRLVRRRETLEDLTRCDVVQD